MSNSDSLSSWENLRYSNRSSCAARARRFSTSTTMNSISWFSRIWLNDLDSSAISRWVATLAWRKSRIDSLTAQFAKPIRWYSAILTCQLRTGLKLRARSSRTTQELKFRWIKSRRLLPALRSIYLISKNSANKQACRSSFRNLSIKTPLNKFYAIFPIIHEEFSSE